MTNKKQKTEEVSAEQKELIEELAELLIEGYFQIQEQKHAATQEEGVLETDISQGKKS